MNCSGLGFNHIKLQLPDHKCITPEYSSKDSLMDILINLDKQIPKNIPIHFVGHSLGGILSLLLAQLRPEQTRSVVAISSPLAGAKAAKYMKWLLPQIKLLSDITPESILIQQLKEEIPQKVMLLISISGGIILPGFEPNDSIVTIASQKAYKTNHKYTIDANHFEVLQHKDTITHITNFIFKNENIDK